MIQHFPSIFPQQNKTMKKILITNVSIANKLKKWKDGMAKNIEWFLL